MAKKKKTLSPLEVKLNTFVATYLTTISFEEKMFFMSHLRTMIGAGISLVEAMTILAKETDNAKFTLIITEMTGKIEQGQSLSDVMAKYPKVFNDAHIKMIGSGEASGKLEEALTQIEVQMEKTHELISSIRGAMIYPAVIFVAMGGIALMMVIYVLPQMTEIFSEFDAELPLATRILIAVTDFMSNPLNLALIVAVCIALVVSYIQMLRKIPAFRAFVHAVNLRMPIFGSVIKKINLARFSLTLSSLLQSALPITQAVGITADTCSNISYKKALRQAQEDITKGIPLSEILATYPDLFPPMVTEMIMIGERTGEVNDLLKQLSAYFSAQVDKTMKNFSTILEPAIILLLGIAVAGMAVAVIMPMYSLAQNF